MKNDALATTAQALSVISQILAITVEAGIIVGGYLIYKNITEKDNEPQTGVQEGVVLVPIAYAGKTTFKEKMEKIKRIVKAVIG